MSKERFSITRQIGIDMGHRVPHHGSKCRNTHGHRYTIEATVTGPLYPEGSGAQEGMVTDFGFLKEVMMEHIDAEFDHGMCLWYKDPYAELLLGDKTDNLFDPTSKHLDAVPFNDRYGSKLILVNFIPTAEMLAAYWFASLQNPIAAMGEGIALTSIKVWETPNNFVVYPPQSAT